MALRYKIKADGGEYKAADGTMKKKYIDIGVIIDGKNGGFMMKLESIPVGWTGWAFLGDPEARPQRAAPAPAQHAAQRAAPAAGDAAGWDDLEDVKF